MIQNIKIGDYIRKNNFVTFGREDDSKPVIKVISLSEMTGKNGGFRSYLVNGIYQVSPKDITIIDEEEARRIIGVWEDSGNISPIFNETENTKCFREDNGKPKVTYHGRKGWQKPLFNFRMKNPLGGFQAYKCPECGKVHIGKTNIEENSEKLKHISVTLSEFTNSQLMEAAGNQIEWQKKGNSDGYPWEILQDATRIIYENYIKPLSGEGFSSWSGSYDLICREIVKRKYENLI